MCTRGHVTRAKYVKSVQNLAHLHRSNKPCQQSSFSKKNNKRSGKDEEPAKHEPNCFLIEKPFGWERHPVVNTCARASRVKLIKKLFKASKV